MKHSTVMLAAAGLVAAQSPTDFFPECAISCLSDAITSATTCSISDYACQCTKANQAAIQGGATACVIASCGADVAVSTVLPAAAKFCAAIAAGGADTTSAASSSAAATSSPAATSPASTSAAASSSAMSSAMSSKVSSSTMATTTGKNATAPPTSTPTPVEVNAAAGNPVSVLGGIAALFLAAVAAL